MRSQQQQKQHNDSGIFSSLKSMANDLMGNSPSHHHQQQSNHSSQQQQSAPKRSTTNVSSTTSTPQINTTTNSNSKTQSLFPSYQTLQTALPQEIERVRSVLQNPNATLSQLEQGDRALDDLVVLLASQLAQLAELKRENSQKLINKLKQQAGNNNSNVSTNSPVSVKSPVSSTNTQQVVKTNSNTTPTTTEGSTNKGFGALANRSGAKPSTPSTNTPPVVSQKATSVPPKSSNPLESMLDWQENEVVVEPPKPKVKEQELFSMDSFDDTFTHSSSNAVAVPPATTSTISMDDDILGFDTTTAATTTNVTESADDILGFETSKPKEGAFLDELLGTEKNSNQGVMIDFSDEGQKIYQSNQILSMFDKPAETTTASILDADDIPVATTTTVNSVDEFDFQEKPFRK